MDGNPVFRGKSFQDKEQSLCMFDKFHLTFNFKSKVSCGVSKIQMNVNQHLHFLLKCHLNVTCLVVHVI